MPPCLLVVFEGSMQFDVPKPARGGYIPPNALQLRGGVYPPRQPRARCSSSGRGSPPPQVMRNAYASWYIMHIDGYACISMDMHASAILPKIQESPYYLGSLWIAIIVRKNENPGLTGKSSFDWEIPSQIKFFTENLIWSYGHCGHFRWSGLT